MRSISLRLIFATRIIEFGCERRINEKQPFKLAIISLSIKLYLLTSQMRPQSFKLI